VNQRTILALGGRTNSGDGSWVVQRGARAIGSVVILDTTDDLPAKGARFDGADVVDAWAVDTVVHWDDGVEPTIARLAFVARLPTVSPPHFRTRYLAHAPIAREQHPGICRYVQHFVVAGTEDDCAAIAELHFADETAMRERFYRDANSAQVVDADISDYLDRERTWSVVVAVT
jgi:hypothetical protein